MKWCFALLSLLAVLCPLRQAQAQAFGDAATAAEPAFGSGNPQLAKLLDLQYQMQLLKKLIEHERSVNNIVTAGIAIGMRNPAIPAPDETLCRQVPGNLPCAQAYAGMYSDFSVASVNAVPSMPDLGPDKVLSEAASEPAPIADKDTVLTAAPENLYWTDITCLAQKCSAVVSPDVKNPNARYRISIGEILPDGAVIQTISAAGVVIQRDKKSIHLEPAPQA